MSLLFIEKVNRLTEKIIDLRSEIRQREGRAPLPQVGVWRHAHNIAALRLKAEYLEKRRLALLDVAPRIMR